MSSIPGSTQAVSMKMDRILQSAVILSWKELLCPAQQGLIQIEYVPGNSLAYLKIWQLTGKGEWSLVCEYWLSAMAKDDGTTFSNGYHSAILPGMLQMIMGNQDHFEAALQTGKPSSIQVQAPNEQDKLAANACMREAYESVGLAFTPASA